MDAALWFADYNTNGIGRITTDGAVTYCTDPSIRAPEGIAFGPDQALGFTNLGSSIGRITPVGPDGIGGGTPGNRS